MSLLVFEFGSADVRSVAEVAERIVDEFVDMAFLVVGTYCEKEGKYRSRDSTLEELIDELREGLASSVIVSDKRGSKGYILIHGPNLDGDRFPYWYVVAEREGEYSRKLLEPFKKVANLLFVSIASEDTLDLDDLELVSPSSFPWGHWRLFGAAVRRQDGIWDQREGPASNGVEASKV